MLWGRQCLPIFVSWDAAHIQKALVRSMRCRQRVWRFGGGFFVNMSSMRSGADQIPQTSFQGSDHQSDKEAALVLCPSFVPDSWDSHGLLLAQFMISLTSSLWLSGSNLFSRAELLCNAMVAYYWLLLTLFGAWQLGGHRQWQRHFLHPVTLRNVSQLMAQLGQRCMEWPCNIPFHPQKTQEWAMECHFGLVKSCFAGVPSVKDSVLSTQRLHLKHRDDLANCKPRDNQGRRYQETMNT